MGKRSKQSKRKEGPRDLSPEEKAGRLRELAAKIQANNSKLLSGERRAAKISSELADIGRKQTPVAISQGRLLAEAKGLLKHGEWEPWYAARGIKRDTCCTYMALARYATTEQKEAKLCSMGIVEAHEYVQSQWQTDTRRDSAEFKDAVEQGRKRAQRPTATWTLRGSTVNYVTSEAPDEPYDMLRNCIADMPSKDRKAMEEAAKRSGKLTLCVTFGKGA